MLNQKQIEKLQKRVAIKVNEKFEKERVEPDRIFIEIENKLKEKKKEYFFNNILPHLKQIKRGILNYEKKYTDRGPCLCIWSGKVYHLDGDRAVPVDKKIGLTEETIISSLDSFDQLGSDGDKKYFMLKKSEYEMEMTIKDWFIENFPHLKFAFVKVKQCQESSQYSDAHDHLSNLHLIGSLSQDFTKKFPSKNHLDFIKYYKDYNDIFMKSINDIKCDGNDGELVNKDE